MLRSHQRHAGSMLDRLVPGYKDKIWNALPDSTKLARINAMNGKFEKAQESHKRWQGQLSQYKSSEEKMAPSPKYRKIAVDWRRQIARGTMHVGRWYEGPPLPGSNRPSDYTPGNTRDRLADVRAPFTPEEWEERKKYRSFDLVKFGYGLILLFIAFRLNGDWPVVWCDEKADEE